MSAGVHMDCYCYETDTDFVLCVENAEAAHEDILLHAWFVKDGNRYIKSYPMEGGADQSWYKENDDKEMIKSNFARLGRSMFEGAFDWENVLLCLARKFSENNIEWYLFGSSCEKALGVDIAPNDIDIVVHTKDFYKVKNIFPDKIVEPFVDNKNTWLVRYFGRLCVDGAIVDIVADEKMNMENDRYDKIVWKDFEVFTQPFKTRYALETKRNRTDRLRAMEEHINSKPL